MTTGRGAEREGDGAAAGVEALAAAVAGGLGAVLEGFEAAGGAGVEDGRGCAALLEVEVEAKAEAEPLAGAGGAGAEVDEREGEGVGPVAGVAALGSTFLRKV